MVSVIITTYKNEQFLSRAIESVLAQSYKNAEILVVDDNDPSSLSRRAAEDIMKNYPDVIYLKHPCNKNGACARNTGIARATGEYIAFLDNDDVYLEDHLKNSIEALNSHPDCICVFSKVVKIRRGICWDIVPPLSGDARKKLLMSETALGTGSNLFVRAEAVRTLQGFDETFLRHQDVEFGLRLLDLGKAAAVDRIGILKEMDGHSNIPDFRKLMQIKRQLWNKYISMIRELSPEDRATVYAGHYHSLLYDACKSGSGDSISHVIARLLAYRPLTLQERIMVLLTRLHMFPAYEALKFAVKKKKSNALMKQVYSEISEKDRRYFDTIS